MNRGIILRRTSPGPLQTLFSNSTSNSSPAQAASSPACGAGLTHRENPAGTALEPAGRGEQELGLVSVQTVETMHLDVHTVSYTETSAQQHNTAAKSDIA